jgi:hypothetical protein
MALTWIFGGCRQPMQGRIVLDWRRPPVRLGPRKQQGPRVRQGWICCVGARAVAPAVMLASRRSLPAPDPGLTERAFADPASSARSGRWRRGRSHRRRSGAPLHERVRPEEILLSGRSLVSKDLAVVVRMSQAGLDLQGGGGRHFASRYFLSALTYRIGQCCSFSTACCADQEYPLTGSNGLWRVEQFGHSFVQKSPHRIGASADVGSQCTGEL